MVFSTPDMPVPDDRPVWDVWLSSVWLPAVLAADELGIFDSLGREPATAEELAERLDLNEHALIGVLALLAGLGLLARRLGRFGPTAAGRLYLRHGEPFYWGEALGVMRSLPTVALLREALRDKSVRRHYQMSRQWTDGQIAAEAAAGVARLMQSQSLPAALGLAALGELRDIRSLLDVGGGSGCFAIALARRYSGLRCTVLELPAMCGVVAGYVDGAGLAGRVDTVAADMFQDPWPRGYDAILLSNVFHDWDAATNGQLAIEAFEALPPGGRILVHEMLLDDGRAGPLPAAAFSVMMLLATGGRQYSARELAGLLTDAGFVDVGVTAAYGYYSLVSARKP